MCLIKMLQESGLCGICGQENSEPYEPSMEFICKKCSIPFGKSQMIPVTKIKFVVLFEPALFLILFSIDVFTEH